MVTIISEKLKATGLTLENCYENHSMRIIENFKNDAIYIHDFNKMAKYERDIYHSSYEKFCTLIEYHICAFIIWI